MLQVISIIEDTMVDGPGFRTAIYAAGCKHQCKGCHNPQSWDFKAGRAMTTDQIMQIIKQDPFANVSFSGGDPMYQPEGFAELAQAIRSQTNKTIWCWTGFSFEMLLRMPKQRELLELIDGNLSWGGFGIEGIKRDEDIVDEEGGEEIAVF